MRSLRLFVMGLCVCGVCQVANAGWSEFWQRNRVDYHRNNCWPSPFQAQDRELTRSPLIAMVNSGWRAHNTLTDHFFSPEDQSINQAGELKVRWIATQAPPHRRTVFVLRAPTPEGTAERVAVVQRTIEKAVADGPRPEVLITDVIPAGASGDYFDQVDRQLKSSIPAPRLPGLEDTSGN